MWLESEVSEGLAEDLKKDIAPYAEYISTIEDGLRIQEALIENCKKAQLTGLIHMINFNAFVLIFHLDILVFAKNVAFADSFYERILNARLIAMTAHEYLDDLPKMYALFKKNMPAEVKSFEPMFAKHVKQLSAVRKDFPFLKIIRNNMSAHRIKDPFAYIKMNELIRWIDFFKLANRITSINNNLLQLYNQAMVVIHEQIEIKLKELQSKRLI